MYTENILLTCIINALVDETKPFEGLVEYPYYELQTDFIWSLN